MPTRENRVKKAMFGALAVAAVFAAAFAGARIAVLLLPVILNWLLCAFLDGKGDVGVTEKRPLIRRHADYAMQSVQFALLEILIAAPWTLCVIIAFSVRLQGAALFLMAGAFFAVVIASDFMSAADGKRNKVLACNWLLAGTVVAGIVLILDRFYFFEFTLLLAAAFLAGLFALHILWNCVVMTWRGAMDDGRRIKVWACLIVLWGGLFYSVMNLSATGGFRMFVDDAGFGLKPSRRAAINSLGFRGGEITIAKPKNTFRIVALGDSATYGWLVSERFTYSRALERLLRGGSRGDVKFEVINAGVPAYDLTRTIFHLEADILKLKPDAIILMTGANDKLLFKKGKYEKYLERFFLSARESGAKVVVCGYPFVKTTKINTAINGKLQGVAERQHAIFVNLQPALTDFDDYFLIDGHPSRQGYAAIAREIFKSLTESGIVREEWLKKGAGRERAGRF